MSNSTSVLMVCESTTIIDLSYHIRTTQLTLRYRMDLGRPHRPESRSGMASAREARKEENDRDEQGTAVQSRHLKEHHNYKGPKASRGLQTWLCNPGSPHFQSRQRQETTRTIE